MVRFQTAYKNHLLKQKEKLELEEREVVSLLGIFHVNMKHPLPPSSFERRKYLVRLVGIHYPHPTPSS
jgi:hypothetical protein